MINEKNYLQVLGYHVHVYCRPDQFNLCRKVREQFMNEVHMIDGLADLHTEPIGPHSLPMFEAWFQKEALDHVIRWMMNHRQGLSVMFHPLTTDHDGYAEHADYCFWLGEKLPLKLEIFKKRV